MFRYNSAVQEQFHLCTILDLLIMLESNHYESCKLILKITLKCLVLF